MSCQGEADLGYQCASLATVGSDIPHRDTDDVLRIDSILHMQGNERNHLIIDQLRPLRLVRYVELSDKYSTTEKVDAHERLFSKFFSNVESILLDETRVGGHQKERAKDDEKEKELKEIKSV